MGQFARFGVGRLTVALVTLAIIAVAVFWAMRMVPGSYADVMLPANARAEARAALIDQYGLDDPLPAQFMTWAGNAVTGDLGTSLTSGEPVLSELGSRALVTVELAFLGGLLALLVGVPLGLIGGISRSRRKTGLIRVGNSVLLSLPDILVGALLVWVISTYEVPFTVGGWEPLFDDPVANLQAALPAALTISVLGMGFVMTTTRGAVAQIASEPYVQAARARGATRGEIVRRHVLRNSSVPVLTVFAVYLAYLLGGTVIAEVLFSLDGIGRYVIDATGHRDYPVVQGAVLVAAAAFVLISMVVDLLYGVLDPRIGARSAS
ncbi:ABC transporter permease [Conexibacter stalactiti]|uniref:ABC transporter permease n=1 Tax=Conexibacter stalactiti TaxID=1940611 RepID=A0ABU4HSB4_9ACTN|nr:ABC transporter permease [Conexibacter stalactiti]MDW5596130.1 ABC transporter permease [Conexibacter stalactiti]MEC5036772.1 ABC transporter permease [Conexibacter stalactiti]